MAYLMVDAGRTQSCVGQGELEGLVIWDVMEMVAIDRAEVLV